MLRVFLHTMATPLSPRRRGFTWLPKRITQRRRMIPSRGLMLSFSGASLLSTLSILTSSVLLTSEHRSTLGGARTGVSIDVPLSSCAPSRTNCFETTSTDGPVPVNLLLLWANTNAVILSLLGNYERGARRVISMPVWIGSHETWGISRARPRSLIRIAPPAFLCFRAARIGIH